MESIVRFFKAIRVFWQIGPAGIIALQGQAMRDPLTNLYNRRFLNEFWEKETEVARRYEQKLNFCLIYLDVNDLKAVNDHEGHAAGDKMLKAFAKTLLDCCRQSDILSRVGGDEFVILIPQTDKAGGEELVRRIYNLLRLLGKPIFFSYGIACYSEDNLDSLDDLIKLADQRMYAHKRGIKTGLKQ